MTFAIIGGGASGLMAAITCAKEHPNDETFLFERQSRVGRKLLATGNGRCNLSNRSLSVQNYHCEDASFPDQILKTFDPLSWFHAQGLFTVSEPSGRIYPLSDAANSVLDVLRYCLELPNLKQVLGCEVRSIKKSGDSFLIKTDGETYSADKVIIACGGLAGSKLGGSMSGYQLLRSFGHSCTKLYPALVQLITESNFVKALKGVRADAAIRVSNGASSSGEVQFTEFGLSGPAIFEISRAVSVDAQNVTVSLDFLRDYSENEIYSVLKKKAKAFPSLPACELLTGVLHNRLGKMLIKNAQVDSDKPCKDLSDDELQQIVSSAKQLNLQVTGTMGMDCAQVTAGGIRTEEFSPETLQSKLCPGLYACGEVLDVDGDCGGYNLHWAWVSGHLAGLLKEESND